MSEEGPKKYTVAEAYTMLLDVLDERPGDRSLGEALTIVAESLDLTLAQERDLMLHYMREHS